MLSGSFMAIYIKIKKVLEKDGVGYYHVFTENFGGANFYVGIDKKTQKISCYLTADFLNPMRIIDLSDPDERIGELPGVGPSILGRLLMKAARVFELGEFPEYLSY